MNENHHTFNLSSEKIIIPQKNRPQNFDFLAVFSTLRWIANKSISVSEIVSVLQSSINDDQFRDVIQYGIVSYYSQNSNMDIVESIYTNININQLTISTTSNYNNNNVNDESISSSPCDRALSIQSIICKIFSFMSVRSLCNCSKVNIQWLYDSFQPYSLYHINIDTILNRKLSHLTNIPIDFSTAESAKLADVDLTRFKHVESIRINETLNKLVDANGLDLKKEDAYCNYVTSLTRVHRLCITNFISVYPRRRPPVIDATLQFLSQNMSHLESIEIVRGKKSPTNFFSLTQFNRPHQVSESNQVSAATSADPDEDTNPTLWGYICDNIGKFGKLQKIVAYCGDSYDEAKGFVTFPKIKNEGGLRILKLSGIKYVRLSFWQSIISNENNLSNIEQFSLEIPHVTAEMKDRFANEIIPTICARIVQKNLKRIELHLPSSLISYRDNNNNNNNDSNNDNNNDNTADRFSASTFFVDNFVHNMLFSIEKLHYFEQQFIKLKCLVKMETVRGMFSSKKQRVMNVKLEILKKRKDKRDALGELESISWDYEGGSFEKNLDHYRNLPIDIVKNVKELELKFNNSFWGVDRLLDFLCIDDHLNKDRNKNKNKNKKEDKKQNIFTWNPSKMNAPATATHAQVQTNGINNANSTIDDRCNKALHVHEICANVDSINIAEGDWHCKECQSKLDSCSDNHEQVVPHDDDAIFNGTFTFAQDENSDMMNELASQQAFSFGNNNDNNNNNNCSKNSTIFNLDWSSLSIDTNSSNIFGNISFTNDSSDNVDKNAKKRISRIEKLTIDGNNKISTQFVFRVLNNYVRFDNNCLKNIKLNGLKLSNIDINDSFDKIEMAVEQSMQFFKENVNTSFDITLDKKVDVSKVDMYASKLIGMFRKVLNDLRYNDNCNTTGDENGRRFRICISTQLVQTLALGDGLTFETDWIKTIVNGFKSMSFDEFESVHKLSDLSQLTKNAKESDCDNDNTRKVALPNGLVTMELLKSGINIWGQKTAQIMCTLRIDFMLLHFCHELHA